MTIRSVMSRQHHNPTQMRRRDGCPIGYGWMIRNDGGHGRVAVVRVVSGYTETDAASVGGSSPLLWSCRSRTTNGLRLMAFDTFR